MSKSTGYIAGIAVVIGVGAILQYFLCCEPRMEGITPTSAAGNAIHTGMPFVIDDPVGDFSVRTDHNFDFLVSSYAYLTPIDPALEDAIDQLGAYLRDKNDITLGIKGYAYPEEENLSAFPTLGEARANAVKSGLIDRGISGNQMTVSGEKLASSLSVADSVVKGPVSYTLIRPVETDSGETEVNIQGNKGPEDLSGFAAELQRKPMVLHFETGSAYVKLTQNERQLISRLNQYIDQNNQAMIEITGHTDNSGSPEVNERLGKERAEFLKSYLVRNGFQADRITTVSRGQSDPIASNDTEAGRAENRRAVMTIKN